MRTRSRRRLGWAAAGALAFVVGAPAAAHAQQTGLFPLSPIHRERTPCPMEDPVYKLYRQQYFGFHPTCWRKFPAGWGCPSPEAPDQAKSFREIPRDKPENGAAGGPGMEGEPAPDEMTPPGAPGAGAAPEGLPPLPATDRSPFNLDTPERPANPAPPGNRPTTDDPRGGLGARNPAPAAEPAEPETGPAASTSRENSEPLLALPDPTAPASGSGPAPGLALGLPVSDPGATAAVDPAQPPATAAPAPKRPRFLSGLFNNILRR